MPKPYLEWIDENSRTRKLEIVDKVFIGRSCTGVDPEKRILVQDAQVSRDHAVISRRAQQLKISDRSKNGTWVNGIRLAAGASCVLADGDTIRLGGFSFQVFYPEDVTHVTDAAILTDGTRVTPTEMVVTNLVADVREFTTFSQEHASSDVYALMKEIFDTFSTIVYNFKGTLKDYAGDAVYAFWGHTVEPISKQAVLACQAAIEQTQKLSEIRAKLSGKNIAAESLQMGWGITTGRVTMSHYGSRSADLALVGDCTNLAFRLSDLANKELSEKIVICAQTADLVREDLKLKDLGDVSIKGRTGKEHIFALNISPDV
ncbi:MAG: adenylate/guanylate cyclase domain-containing protein [Desulfobacterales bacterium]|jgi:class 3 adenylate cyclase